MGRWPLRVGALAAEASEAARDSDGGETPGDDGVVGGKTRNVVEGSISNGEVILAGLGAVEAEADIEDFIGAEEAGVAEGDLLVEDTNVAVGLAIKGDRNAGIVNAIFLAIADSQEGGVGAVDLPVEAEVAFVGVIGERYLDGVVTRSQACGVSPRTETADRQCG